MIKKYYNTQDDFAADFSAEFHIDEDDAFSFCSLMIDCSIFKIDDKTGMIKTDRGQIYQMIGAFYELSDFDDMSKPLMNYDYMKRYSDPSLLFDLGYYMQLIYKNNR